MTGGRRPECYTFPAMPGPDPQLASAPSPSETLLLVDDDAYFLAWLSTILEGQGFTVLKASHAQDALQRGAKHTGPIHLILTDLLLPPKALQLQAGTQTSPRMHGLQLMRAITDMRPGIKAILMSGHSDQELSALKISREGYPFLRKPFNVDMLLWTVNAVLGHPQ
jgi:two-component system cell cycle sensor histidine kinase/response regulator CckA